jgi:hypothetical protein
LVFVHKGAFPLRALAPTHWDDRPRFLVSKQKITCQDANQTLRLVILVVLRQTGTIRREKKRGKPTISMPGLILIHRLQPGKEKPLIS